MHCRAVRAVHHCAAIDRRANNTQHSKTNQSSHCAADDKRANRHCQRACSSRRATDAAHA